MGRQFKKRRPFGSKPKAARKLTYPSYDSTGYKAYRIFRSWQRSQPPQADAHVKAYRRRKQLMAAKTAARTAEHRHQIWKAQKSKKGSQGARFMKRFQ